MKTLLVTQSKTNLRPRTPLVILIRNDRMILRCIAKIDSVYHVELLKKMSETLSFSFCRDVLEWKSVSLSRRCLPFITHEEVHLPKRVSELAVH